MAGKTETPAEIHDQELPEAADNGAAPPAKSLTEKLVEVMAEVTSVEKDGHNDFHDYDYTTAEAMLKAIRGPLAERGVMLLTSVEDIQRQGTLTTVKVRFSFVDQNGSDGPQGQPWPLSMTWYGTGDDKGDKGL